jgi:pyruvate dehydrogenase E1 component alpha subunit
MDAVAVSFFGDGAVGAGSFHEAMNISSLWQLPAIWICESNGWQSGNQTSVGMAATDVSALGEAHRIPSRQIDGNDVALVASAAREAVDRARQGGGPYLIDAVTYRLDGHSIRKNSPADSRPEELLIPWRSRDPILRAEATLIDQELADVSTIQQMRSAVADEVERAIEFARSSPEPSLESALDGVFSEEIEVA